MSDSTERDTPSKADGGCDCGECRERALRAEVERLREDRDTLRENCKAWREGYERLRDRNG